jgi:hypothetical protein
MDQNKLRWLWYLSAVATLCLTGVILYLFIAHSDISYLYRDIYRDYSDVFYFTVCFYVVVDIIAFAIGYSMLQKLNLLASCEFAIYLAVIVVGNILIVFLLSPMAAANFLYFIFTVFILLTFFNYAISEIFFDEGVRDTCLISMLIGLVNTILGIMFIPVGG